MRTDAVRAFVLVTLILPAILTVSALALQWNALSSTPDPIAVNWGIDGTPGEYAPAWTTLFGTALVGLGLPALIAASALPGLRRGDRGPSYRVLGAVALSTSAVVCTLLTTMMCAQQGLEDASEARLPAWWMLVLVVVAAVGGALGWLIQPKQEVVHTGTVEFEPRHLDSGQRAVWSTEVAAPRGLRIAAVVLTGAVWLGALWVLLFSRSTELAWVLPLLGVILLVAAATSLAFRVRVDSTGLTVVSVIGVPRFHVPLGDIAAVSVSEVNPLGQFGGYGFRQMPGAFGVVVRAGEGIHVERTSGRRFVVTVDDATTGAALLQGYLDREQTTT